jgi:hypothetical protein
MEEVLEGAGTIQMKYNYLTHDRKLFRINESFDYEKIIRIKATQGCNCAGNVNTFYIVNGSRIPTNRALKID